MFKKDKVRAQITEDEFLQKLENEDGNFRNFIFDFNVILEDVVVDFPLDFTGSEFMKKLKLDDSTFYEKVSFNNASFKQFFKAKRAVFKDDVDFSKAIFRSDFNISSSIFEKDFFAQHTIFKRIAEFSYCRFKGNSFFIKTHFYGLAIFSYIFLYKEKQVSFVSINKTYEFENQKTKAPFLVFRAVYFYENVEFRDVDLSRTVFQDSTFEDKVYFKECTFAQKIGRDCFYEEIAQEEYFSINKKYFKSFLRQKTIFLLVPDNLKNENIKKLNITDRIIFRNYGIDDDLWKEYFIIAKDEVHDIDWKKNNLEKKYSDFDFSESFEILSDLENKKDLKNKELVDSEKNIEKYYIFKLKLFKEEKSWENIEFLSRQMKRNLAASTNWQKSGDFYIGEMRAKIKKLALKEEDFFYRMFLHFYDFVSGFGERIWKVVLTMFLSFVAVYFVIEFLQPKLGFYESIKYIVTLFIPIFGEKGFSALDIEWGNRASIFFMGATFWFYILWFLLILSIQRKFKK